MISDYNGIDHIDPTTSHLRRSRSPPGVNAGIDMFMQPSNFETVRVDARPAAGRSERHRLDGAHRRRGVAAS